MHDKAKRIRKKLTIPALRLLDRRERVPLKLAELDTEPQTERLPAAFFAECGGFAGGTGYKFGTAEPEI